MKPASTLRHPLDSILGTVAAVRVLRALSEHGEALSAPTLAARARVARQSVWNALIRLENLGVVEPVGQGRSMSFRLRRSHALVEPLRALFAAEASRSDRLLEVIRQIANRMRPAPLAIWLYGSVARAEDQPGSDVDLAVIGRGPDAHRQADAIREALTEFAADAEYRLSVISLSQAEARSLAERSDPFWTELERDASVVFGASPAHVLRG